MKKLILLTLFLPIAIFGQSSSLVPLANFSEADSNRAHISVSGKAFDLMSKMEADSAIDEQVKRLAAGLKGMDGYMGFTRATAKQMIEKLEKAGNFDQYAEFSKKDRLIRFYIDENKGVVKEMIMVAYDKKEGYAGSVYGSMDVKDVGELYKLVNMRGFEYLDKNEEK